MFHNKERKGVVGAGKMTWRERLLERFFGDIVAARVREASLAEEDRYWRAISTAAGGRDVPYRERLDEIVDSAEAYRKNPLAFRIVELTTDYVLGRGTKVQADEEGAQAFVERFWFHPLNRMDVRQFEWCTELSLSGELFDTVKNK